MRLRRLTCEFCQDGTTLAFVMLEVAGRYTVFQVVKQWARRYILKKLKAEEPWTPGDYPMSSQTFSFCAHHVMAYKRSEDPETIAQAAKALGLSPNNPIFKRDFWTYIDQSTRWRIRYVPVLCALCQQKMGWRVVFAKAYRSNGICDDCIKSRKNAPVDNYYRPAPPRREGEEHSKL
jgi:hypothetical protein